MGHDHEYSDTYFAAAAEYFQEPETDLLAGREPDPRAVDALIAADAEVTEAHVTAVIGPTGWDPAAGAAAAREFRRV